MKCRDLPKSFSSKISKHRSDSDNLNADPTRGPMNVMQVLVALLLPTDLLYCSYDLVGTLML